MILRLIDRLIDAEIAGALRPACPRCHRVVRINKPLDGQRVCRTCIAHSRIEECSRCGARREPARRDDQGRPLCPNCLITDPANLESCINCGRRRLVDTRTPDGPLCPSCPPLPLSTCSICVKEKPRGTSRINGRPWCPACQRRSASRSACGRLAAIASGTLARPLCADCTTPEVWHTCPTCGDPGHPRPGQCVRCLINRCLNDLLGPASDTLHPGLEALRHNIATTEHPTTARRWLNKPSIAAVLSDLAAGRRPLTHQGLDELPDSPPLAHLRQVLVGVGAPPERDEHMTRAERFLAGPIASQHDPDQRQLLHHYTIWHLVRRLRRHNNGRPVTPQQFDSIRQRTHAAVAFLDWLTAHDLTLDTCRQADLDRWLTDNSATYRQTAGHFIRWARTNKLTTAHVPAHRWNGPTQPLDNKRRWDIARRLLHDDTLKPEDRLAGLLLLYTQGAAAAISRLTIKDVDVSAQTAHLRLGEAPVQLPEPVAALARTVAAKHKGARDHRGPGPLSLPLPRWSTRTADQHHTADQAIDPARDPTQPGPQHRALPARHRDPCRDPRPHPGHPHRCRRRRATSLRRPLGQLRRRSELADNHHQGVLIMISRPYDAVLCDIDGVLRHWPSADDIDRIHGLPAGTLAAAAFAPSRLHPAITGGITDEQWRSAVAEDLAEMCGSTARAHAAVTAWSDLVPRVDREIVSLLAQARAVATTALVSNATTRLEWDLARQGLDDLADTVVNTARIGFMKPDPRVYLLAAEQVGTPVHRCLFIDDTAANVTAAREVGMTALHYRQIEDLRGALAPLLSTAPDAQQT